MIQMRCGLFCCENKIYYAINLRVKSAQGFLTLVIDNWFEMA